ncbi:YveK family protein [Clostridium omnivorum]|uniref:Capsular polysaccharide biosynthesis protein n=1 Tax=Clostridium omnivorum TaxID=1604902 RepID=A0ABQ5N0G5_9CLOT|nr:Wzz/FepE/Etk N-terminal domain-containing protein [Clostridium sp. E14]GLC28689.1 capsular polysaccharide biosynthesis protein [Clostridium sp. E14]
MELHEYLQIFRKRWTLIVLITLITTLSSAVVSFFVIKPTYKADISVIIGKPKTESSANQTNYNDVMMYQKLVKTYSQFAQSRTVAENVINKMNLTMKVETLQSMISVSPMGDTEFLTITVKSKDPKQAMDIANQLAKSLKEVSYNVNKSDNVQMLDNAQLPTRPASPKPLLNIAIAFFIGLMLSVGVVFIIEYLDNTVKSAEEIEKLVGLPVIGVIPNIKDFE